LKDISMQTIYANSTAALHFAANLPAKPYCSADLSRLTIRPAKTALNYAYIQPNDPFNCRWVVFDVDLGADSFHRFEDKQTAVPNLIVQNPANQNCHYLYLLKTPVWTKNTGRLVPQNYLNCIKTTMTARLDADPCYTGLICKNPLSDEWRTTELYSGLYSLDDLAKHLDLSANSLQTAQNHAYRQLESSVINGRNDYLFQLLRLFSYERITKYRELSATIGNSKAFEMWANAITKEAERINREFPNGLPVGEVKSTAKSVFNWTWERYHPAERVQRGKMGFGETRHTNPDMPTLSEEERKRRQSLSAQLTNKHRKESTELQIKQAIERLQANGEKVTKSAVAKMTGLARSKIVENYSHLFPEKVSPTVAIR
jgi:hypothetical protein